MELKAMELGKSRGLKAVFIVLVCAFLAISARPGHAAEAGKKVLRYGVIPMKVGLDMQLNTYVATSDIADHIVEPLFSYDDNMELVPVLVKEIPYPSEDGLRYRFELKPGIKFHDGSTLKASDVKYTLERMFTPSTGALMPYICDMIKGAKEMLDGKSTGLEGFKIIDDETFEIELAYPYSPFIPALSTPYAGIYPEKACREAGKDWGVTTYFGSGPFKIAKLDLDNGIMTERFADYHGTAPKLDGLEFIFVEDHNTRRMEYQRGNIDVMLLDAPLYPEYSKDPVLGKEIGEFHPMGLIYVRPNFKFPPLDNVKVREALSLAVDREVLARDLMKGTVRVATTYIPPALLGYDKDAPAYPYDTEKAKKLLAEAGFPEGFVLDAYIRNTDINTTTGRTMLALQAQFKKIGVTLNVNQVDAATWTDMRRAGKIPMFIGNWYADFVDPDGFIYSSMYSTNAKVLSSNYNNPEFDRLLDEARAIIDPAKRFELYRKADQIATRSDFASFPLFNENLYYLAKPYVKNFKVTPAYDFHFFNTDLDLSLMK